MRGFHQGQRPNTPHPKAGYMDAILFSPPTSFFLASRGEPYMARKLMAVGSCHALHYSLNACFRPQNGPSKPVLGPVFGPVFNDFYRLLNMLAWSDPVGFCGVSTARRRCRYCREARGSAALPVTRSKGLFTNKAAGGRFFGAHL